MLLLALWVVDVAGTRVGTAAVLLAPSSRLRSCKEAARGDALASATAVLVEAGLAVESEFAAVVSAASTVWAAEGGAKGAAALCAACGGGCAGVAGAIACG